MMIVEYEACLELPGTNLARRRLLHPSKPATTTPYRRSRAGVCLWIAKCRGRDELCLVECIFSKSVSWPFADLRTSTGSCSRKVNCAINLLLTISLAAFPRLHRWPDAHTGLLRGSTFVIRVCRATARFACCVHPRDSAER